jgi:Zn-dependent peptidase ImmA (M78 family)
MIRVEVKPELLSWARERAGLSVEALARRFPHLGAWERAEARPTLNQLEGFAKATYTPVGFLLLPEPPVEAVPIPDFRASTGPSPRGRPSADLLDTIYICQQRQEWFRDFARAEGEDPLPFVGSANTSVAVEEAATTIRGTLGFDLEERRRAPTWTEALRIFIERADAAGVLVMCSGVVLNNNRRHLDPEEFRGFAMADDLAPVVFVNGADTKAGQMFTVAHELAHLWLGESALSDAQARLIPDHRVERWCNQVAAELLVPLDIFRAEYTRVASAPLRGELDRLAKRFKVSTLVILRRMHDAGGLTWDEFWAAYDDELERLRKMPRGSGGNFYLTQAARVSKRFARALVISTLEGRTLYRDAFRMLGVSKLETFRELGRSLEIAS